MNKVEMLWDELDHVIIDNWIESMTGRFRECLKTKRERINYKIDI